MSLNCHCYWHSVLPKYIHWHYAIINVQTTIETCISDPKDCHIHCRPSRADLDAQLMSARGGVCVPARQRRWLFQWLVAAWWGIALSRSPLPARGTVYRRLSHRRRHCRLSNDIWRRTCLRPRTDGAADPLVSFSVYRTCRLFLCVTCPCSFWTKRHANLLVNNNNNNNNNKDILAWRPWLMLNNKR